MAGTEEGSLSRPPASYPEQIRESVRTPMTEHRSVASSEAAPRTEAEPVTLTAFLRRMPWGTHVDLGRYGHPFQGCWASGEVRYDDGPPVFKFHIRNDGGLERVEVSDKATYGDVQRYRALIDQIGEAHRGD